MTSFLSCKILEEQRKGFRMKERTLPELLAPVGSMESLRAAVNNGADAVYLGGKQFGARAYANNFGLTELAEAMDYCHLRGVKVYVTVNTIYKDSERQALLQFVHSLYTMGADALIMQDLGAASEIHRLFPDLPLHASTQLTANSRQDVEALQKLGFEKVVLSRELNLAEIKAIHAQVDVELETFIHGALCVSYSGQCIMSSMLGGRSGNRGRCAQTCRLPFGLYEGYTKKAEGHLLSTKDIETIAILPQLIESGISSFKIEGRMKTPEYVAGVTAIYRKYMDLYAKNPAEYAVEEADQKRLLQLFNRGGFSEGYYFTHSGRDMMSPMRPKSWGLKLGFVDSYDKKHGRVAIRTREPMVPGDGIEIWTQSEPHVGSNINKASRAGEVISLSLQGDIQKNDVVYKTNDKALNDLLKATYAKDTRTKAICGAFFAKPGSPMTLKVWDKDGNEGFAVGAVAQEAQNQPLSEEKLKSQLSKTGGTSFAMEEMTITVEGNLYVPMGELNQLRRDAIADLEKKLLERSHRKGLEKLPKVQVQNGQFHYEKMMTVLVTTHAQFMAAVTHSSIGRLYVEINRETEPLFDEMIEQAHQAGIALYAALPRVFRAYGKKRYETLLQHLLDSRLDGFLVRSMGQLDACRKTGKKLVADFSFNAFNSADVAFWSSQGVESLCLSPEMNLTEINEAATTLCEMVVYGHLPLMTTHQCPIGNFAGNKESGMYCDLRHNGGQWYLKDRKGEEFPLLTDCELCVCSILNGKPLFTLKFFEELLATPTGSIRLQFTLEDAAQTDRIIEAHESALEEWVDLKPMVRSLIRDMSQKGSTKGHYFRGIE